MPEWEVYTAEVYFHSKPKLAKNCDLVYLDRYPFTEIEAYLQAINLFCVPTQRLIGML